MNIRLLFCFLLFFPITVFCQNDGGSVSTPAQLWNEILLTQGINNKFVLQTDLQWNSTDDLNGDYHINKYLMNYGIRAWCHYFYTPRLKFSGSLGYYINPEVAAIKQMSQTEIRPAFQVQNFKIFDRFTFYNKLRYETRFLHQTATDVNSVSHRLRFIPKLFIAINGKTIRAKSVYLIVSNDMFFVINQGKFIDQNRIIGGFGYCFTDNIKLELTYVNKLVFKSNGPNELTNALSVSLSLNNISEIFNGD